jgi:hypothetical protein
MIRLVLASLWLLALNWQKSDQDCIVQWHNSENGFVPNGSIKPHGVLLTDGASFVGFAYQGKDMVFRFIVECSSLRDFSP